MTIRCIYGNDESVTRWVARLVPRFTPFGAYTAIGVADDDVPIAGGVFHNFRNHGEGRGDIEVTFASIDPRWALRTIIAQFFGYAFFQLGCTRMTCITGRHNKRTRKLLKGLGFKEEGKHPRALDGIEDAISYGMLRKNCRWIESAAMKGAEHGQERAINTSAA